MLFLHCAVCNATVRSLADATSSTSELARDDTIEEFHRAHARCRTSVYFPTGDAESSLPWHEPLAERRIEVSGSDGHALAVGKRSDLDSPLEWRLDPIAVDEELSIALDREAFFRVLDRALFPNHLPVRSLSQWATQIEEFLARVSPADLVVLHDDPRRANVSHACLTLTARVSLEAGLSRRGLDEESTRRLLATFEDPEFPPLAVTRRLVRSASQAA